MSTSAKTPEDPHTDLREGVRSLCTQFDSAYWQKVDEERGYPDAFVDALTQAGWLSALIPEEFGGSGLTLTQASVIMEEINRSGANSGAVHGQMYNMGTVLRHGSPEQKRKYLPKIATGELRLQSMAVTEPTAGTDTTKIKTTAVRKGDRYVINGQKVWTSRLQHSDLMIVLARTTPLEQVQKKSEGMSIFLVDVRRASASSLVVKPIRNMVNHETNQIFFDELEVPAENLIGEEGRGFRYILDGLNAERILIAAECIGDGYWFIDRARAYANERVVFDRPIGKNQGIQFPIARAYVNVEAANLMRYKAAALFDAHRQCGAEANMAKLLAADASWEAANVCLQTHGGFGFAAEYDVERKFRETRLYQVAPISTNLILSYIGEHVLGMPRSF
ncbi:MAG TPA: acyl-CoA dehydrogenase family protein [Burkholderiales bacterium]|jgi:acyl-CoA dehydrogenase|nr:acyl-CoA dehydrogenase family protein [Burkholderiales bacterium]